MNSFGVEVASTSSRTGKFDTLMTLLNFYKEIKQCVHIRISQTSNVPFHFSIFGDTPEFINIPPENKLAARLP